MNHRNKLLLLLALFIFSFSFINAASINIVSPQNNTDFNYLGVNVNYTVINSSNSLCWYTLNNIKGSDILCSNNSILINMNEGINNTLGLYINESNITTGVFLTLNIDTQSPLVSITYPKNNGYYNSFITSLNYNISDPHIFNNCWFTNGIINSAPITCNNLVTAIDASYIGLNTWSIYANDSYGNIGSQSISFTIDSAIPVLTSLNYTIKANSIKIIYTSNESTNITVRYSSDSNNLNNTNTESSYDDSNDIYLDNLYNATTYYLQIIICDRANNCYVNPTVSLTTNLTDHPVPCQTTYTCSDWGVCQSDNSQIRSCTKINMSCDAPIVPVRQACSSLVLTPQPNASAILNNSSNSNWYHDIPNNYKIIFYVLCGVGLLIFIIYKLYSYFFSVDSSYYNTSLNMDSKEDLNKFVEDNYE